VRFANRQSRRAHITSYDRSGIPDHNHIWKTHLSFLTLHGHSKDEPVGRENGWNQVIILQVFIVLMDCIFLSIGVHFYTNNHRRSEASEATAPRQ